MLACRADDPYAGRETVAMSDLVGRNLIGYPRGWAMRTLADRAARESGTLLDVNLEVNDTSTLLDLVEAGLGFALIAEAMVTQRPALRAVPLRGAEVDWIISAVAAAPAPANPAARELWRVITQASHRAERRATDTKKPDGGQ